MDTEFEMPESVRIRATLGIFVMERSGESSYKGSANGFELAVKIIVNSDNRSFGAVLTSPAGRWASAETTLNGEFSDFDSLSAYIASWADNECRESIEDYAGDVRYLETPDGKLAYWAYNTHLDTDPVVFVHGGPGGDSNPVKARRLHLDNPVYLFDQMGCGMSDPIKNLDNWKIENYYDEMDRFIESIPSDKVILCGASWGSGLSVYYAGRSQCRKISAMMLPSPFLSSKLWTEDACLNLRDMGGDYYEKAMECISKSDYGEEFKRILGEYNSRYLFNRSIFREYALASAEEVPNEVFRVLCGPNDLVTDGKLKDFDVVGMLDDIHVPVLLMCADSDEIRIDRLLEYRKHLGNSRLSVIPHAGHVLALEQFDGYRDAITAFLREL